MSLPFAHVARNLPRMAQLGVHVDLLRCRQLPSNVPVLEQAL